MILKWGEAGAGRISHDFVTAVQTFLPSEHKFVAVADQRSKENAEDFAKDHGIPRAYGDYLSLARDQEVDIVHVGTITPLHFEITKILLQHGKHVLCEKPMTLSENETRELYEIAEAEKLFLIEGLWTSCFPAIDETKRMIRAGEIGEVLFVSAQIGQALQHMERVTSPKLGGGAILDLGLYALLFQSYIFGDYTPSKIVVNGHLNSSGTDESCSAIITYPGEKTAIITTSARVYLPTEAVVVGTKGWLKVPDFFCPTKLVTSSGEKSFPLPYSDKVKGKFLHHNSAGLSYEAEEVRRCIMEGNIESPKITHAESIQLVKMTDYLRKEIGSKTN